MCEMVTAVLPHFTETWPGDTFPYDPSKQSPHTPRWPILSRDTEAQATVMPSFPLIVPNAAKLQPANQREHSIRLSLPGSHPGSPTLSPTCQG